MHHVKRRDFIKNTLMAGMGATVANNDLLTGKKPEELNTPHQNRKPKGVKKIIVGGAGIAGLCCAYELMKKGHDVTILEASGRHGGHVLTVQDGLSDGLYGDFGQEHITKQGYTKYWDYIKEFDLAFLPYLRRKQMLRRINGKFYTEEMLADKSILRQFGFNEKEVNYLSENRWRDLQLLYIKPYLERFKDEYQPFNVGYDDLDKIPVSDIYKKEGASKAALSFLGGDNASGLYQLWTSYIRHVRGIPLSSPDTFRLRGGNQMLPNAFAKRLGERVLLGCPITSIKNGESGVTVTISAITRQNNCLLIIL